jgi:hypothetical protein
MAKSITYVGLDVHKDTIAVALAEAGLRGEVREYGKVPQHSWRIEGTGCEARACEGRTALLL